MKYKSDNDEPRVYPSLGLTVEPDEVIELPDGIEAIGLKPVLEKVVKATTVKVADDSAERDSE